MPLVISLLLAWYVAGRVGATGTNFPSLQGVGHAAHVLLGNGSLVAAAKGSWNRVIRGFAIAALCGVPLGLLLGASRRARDWLEPIIDVLRPIAPFAWIPMAILWFGGSNWASVFITAYAAFFPIVTNTLAGVRRVDHRLVLAARTLGAKRTAIFTRIILPGAMPMIVVGLRLGIGYSWAAVVAAEIATGQSSTGSGGLGFMLYTNLAVTFDMAVIVVAMIAIGISAYLVDALIAFADRRLIFWPSE